jgi:hypothetical protein
MGFIEKAIERQKRKIKKAAKAKVKKVALKATPGLCPKTGGLHKYGNQNKGGTPVIACKCGKVP